MCVHLQVVQWFQLQCGPSVNVVLRSNLILPDIETNDGKWTTVLERGVLLIRRLWRPPNRDRCTITWSTARGELFLTWTPPACAYTWRTPWVYGGLFMGKSSGCGFGWATMAAAAVARINETSLNWTMFKLSSRNATWGQFSDQRKVMGDECLWGNLNEDQPEESGKMGRRRF